MWYCPANFHQYTATYQKHVSHIAALAHCVQQVGRSNSCRGPRLPASSLEQDDSAAILPAWTLSLSSHPTWTEVHQATSLAPSSQLHLAKLRVDEVLSALNLDKINHEDKQNNIMRVTINITHTSKFKNEYVTLTASQLMRPLPLYAASVCRLKWVQYYIVSLDSRLLVIHTTIDH